MLKTAKSDKERIMQFRRYINNNWKGIEIKKKENCGGCGVEGQVSHVLSGGGEIQSEHLKKKAIIEKYIEKAIKRQRKPFKV